MYRLQFSENNIWAVLDEADQDVFRGTLPECERWLDAAENRCPTCAETADFRLRDWLPLILTQGSAADWRSPVGSSAAGRFDK